MIKYRGNIYRVKRNGSLILNNKGIEDISELEGLESLFDLKKLYLRNNNITEIKGLDHLTNLTILNLAYNKINEIKGLDHLDNLKELYLNDNNISELTGLGNLSKLNSLTLANNPLSEGLVKSLGGWGYMGFVKEASNFVEYCHRNEIIELKKKEELKKLKNQTLKYLIRLPDLYEEVSFENISSNTGMPVVELFRLIEELIIEGKIDAIIKGNQLVFKKDEEISSSQVSQELRTKLTKLMKISSKIRIEDLASVLKLERATLFDKLIDWSDEFSYEIDGDFLNVNKDSISSFIEALDKQFISWKVQEESHEGKI